MNRICRGRGKLGKTGVWSLLQDTEMLHLVQMKPLWQIGGGKWPPLVLGRTEIKGVFVTVAKNYGAS